MTIDEQIKKADAKIAELEAALRVAQEHRRELVNRGNLNKCGYAGALYCLWGAGIMTTTVTKESLAARIAELESGPRSLKEDYTIAAYKMLLATMEAEPEVQELDEREAFEAFMEGRFGDTVDRRRAKNGDQGYMAWDMVMAWETWKARARPAPLLSDELKEAAADLLTVLDEYPEQLVPINRRSPVVRALRSAVLDQK